MPKPRVFVSSTYYDLKHVRADLSRLVRELGYEPILSEKGDIAYDPSRALDESCYREVGTADIFVVIVGGRYGSRASADNDKSSHERYDSITRRELETAIEQQIPTYVLVERGVFAEYRTYLQNKGVDQIKYVHVDSVEIYRTIEWIEAQKKNNPIQPFDQVEDITQWLRDQWAGLFRDLLNRETTDQRITDLADQVDSLKEINVTLKRYLEDLVKKEDASPSGTTVVESGSGRSLIEAEERRLVQAEIRRKLRQNPFVKWLMSHVVQFETKEAEDPLTAAIRLIVSVTSKDELLQKLKALLPPGIEPQAAFNPDTVFSISNAQRDFNAAREILGKQPIGFLKFN